MRPRHLIPTAAATFAILVASGAAAQTAQPYAGLEQREVKALAPEQVEGLLEGRGLGYAQAAELNGLPGPLHVLELKDQLALDDAQLQRIAEIHARMKADARELGAEIVKLEKRLDAHFADGTASPDAVSDLTGRIAKAEGRLRAVHLNAHLETTPVLTRHQTHTYNEARGYGGHSPARHHHGHGG